MANIDTIQIGTATYSVYDASAVHTQYTHPTPVTAGTIGTTAATSGKTIDIPYAKFNANGHITEKGTHVHTISSLDTSAISSGVLSNARGGTGNAGYGTWGQFNGSLMATSIANQTWTEVASLVNSVAYNGIWLVYGGVMYNSNSTGSRAVAVFHQKNKTSWSNSEINAYGTRVGAGTAATAVNVTALLNVNSSTFSLYTWQNSGAALSLVTGSLKFFFLGNPQ